jgi:spectrin beta
LILPDCLLQKFLTDLSASSKRVEALDAVVEDFMQQGHSQLDKVQARHKHIHQLWDHLNWLKGQKERSLEGASRYLHHSVVDSYMKVLNT